MTLLLPKGTLAGPQSNLIGGLTGLLQGLSQGIPIAAQMRNRAEESQRQNTELAMQALATKRRNDRQDASKRAAALLLQFGGMAPGAASNGSGPSSQPGATAGSAAPGLSGFQTVHPGAKPGDLADLGQEQGPGVSGGALQGAPEQPQYTGAGPSASAPTAYQPHSARFAWLFNAVKGMDLSPEDAEKVLEAGAHDDRLYAVQQHAQRVGGAIQQGLDKGLYDSVDKFGNHDTSGRVAAQSVLDEINRADMSDPNHVAAILDKAEEADRALKMAGAQKQSIFEQRQRQDQMFQQDRAARAGLPHVSGHPDVALAEMDDAYNQWSRGLISDEEMSKRWELAKNGGFEQHQRMQELQARNAELENALRTQQITEARNKAEAESPEGRARQSALDTAKGVAIKKAETRTPPRGATKLSNAEALKTIRETLDSEFSNHGMKSETPEQKAAYDQRENELRADVGFPPRGFQGPAAGTNGAPSAIQGHEDEVMDIIDRMKSGELDKAGAREELKKLGIDPDAAGG